MIVEFASSLNLTWLFYCYLKKKKLQFHPSTLGCLTTYGLRYSYNCCIFLYYLNYQLNQYFFILYKLPIESLKIKLSDF
jgi:hypothetical protein